MGPGPSEHQSPAVDQTDRWSQLEKDYSTTSLGGKTLDSYI